MRIVYDDTKQREMVNLVDEWVSMLILENYARYSYGMEQIDMTLIREELDNFLSKAAFRIGSKVTHTYDIVNNCCYPVYYYSADKTGIVKEIQHVGNININKGHFGEVYVYCSDYDDKCVGNSFEINSDRISVRPSDDSPQKPKHKNYER